MTKQTKYPADLMGLKPDEYDRVLEIMGREPNRVELGIFSVMWSEHCSYKSSKKWLKTLPTKAAWVIQGPGENAGVIDIGDGLAAIFKMESHNHPSFIEPYQGAATGVGGILRDVFTMGARPIANLNALRFGAPEHPKTRHLVSGVVHGIGGYGNCVGVPTVAGEVNFHPSYNGNILVNAMTVGLAKQDKIFYSAAAGLGNPVVYVGSKTGRDGIHGATMASAEFSDDSEEKRPTVQVGDPFTEKLLIEACLELMETDVIVAIQDMGAAGLTSSSFEMASKGGMGIEIDLDKVPARETGMTPFEFMLSESQERMLIILKPGSEPKAEAIFKKWELDFAVIGHLTDTGRMVLRFNGEQVGDLPIDPLAQASPEYDRPWVPTPPPAPLNPVNHPLPMPKALLKIIGSPDMASRRWIWEQYDHLVRGDTAQIPGGDAAVVRVQDHPSKALAMSVDCTPRYCFADPVQGGRQAVAETWRNITAVGARPLAITDNMNFGNPERPDIMGQFVGAVQGIGEACIALDYPVVSGNVSLYNETNGKGILPTPAIGGVGVLDDVAKMMTLAFKRPGEAILVLGETKGHLGQSIYLREVLGREEGPPPPVDLAIERRNGDFLRGLILEGAVTAAHDLSDGGLLVGVAEMALAGDIGADISLTEGDAFGAAFGEDQARYLVTCPASQADALLGKAEKAGIPATRLGMTGGQDLTVADQGTISLAELRQAHEGWLPGYMAGKA
ncbi:phosphoribosylformylglycinamidine synthase subunit PurL [Ferrovibrio sp.]|uniref:phosphoribosylformylglycinamidine synthase subunit PurL n=1 Tax=Ferrovibrio sp. TaxID=1917215 RepID=UPI0025C41A37|nr:phosphoribosylformylglycinamidine synthase subunit PurL [Ferrovibrio sp.]MBX3453455.1 phosphoribosylformylglycinamidine synthase subunit PurL [Ferrovibrio sp.]